MWTVWQLRLTKVTPQQQVRLQTVLEKEFPGIGGSLSFLIASDLGFGWVQGVAQVMLFFISFNYFMCCKLSLTPYGGASIWTQLHLKQLSFPGVVLTICVISGDDFLHPSDILPFTRRPLFIVVDSDNSSVFEVMLLFNQPVIFLSAWTFDKT